MTNVNKQLPKHLDDAWDNLMEVFNPMSNEHKEELDVSIDNTHLTQLGVMVDLKNPKTNISDAIIKTKVIQAINEFFALDNWDFGDSFYFTELAAFIHQQLAPDLLTVVIVPNQAGQSFGSLFQIECASDEIFISGATVNDVSTITALGANQLLASGTVVTSTSTTTTNTTTGSAVSGSTTSGSGSNTGSSGAGY